MIKMYINAFGFNLYISYTFAAMISLALILDTTNKTAFCLCAAVLHECGHLVIMRCFNTKNIEISLSPFDFKIVDNDSKTRRYLQDVLISLAGPCVNFLLFPLFYAFDITRDFAFANLTIGIFNIIPVQSLDGGKILMSLLMTRFSQKKCLLVCNILSAAVIIPLLIFGIYIFISTGYNFSLLLICCYLILLMIFKKG